MSSKMIEISEERYEKLLHAWLFLNCLERAGVDNWDWYGEAQSEYRDIIEAGEY